MDSVETQKQKFLELLLFYYKKAGKEKIKIPVKTLQDANFGNLEQQGIFFSVICPSLKNEGILKSFIFLPMTSFLPDHEANLELFEKAYADDKDGWERMKEIARKDKHEFWKSHDEGRQDRYYSYIFEVNGTKLEDWARKNSKVSVSQIDEAFAKDRQNIEISRAWFEAIANDTKPALEAYQTYVAQTLINLEPFRRTVEENAKIISNGSKDIVMPNIEAIKPMFKDIEASLNRVKEIYAPPQKFMLTAPLPPRISEVVQRNELVNEVRALRIRVEELTDGKSNTQSVQPKEPTKSETDFRAGVLYFQNKEFDFNNKPNQKELLDIIFKDRHRDWFYDEMLEEWDELKKLNLIKLPEKYWKKFDTAGNSINEAIAIETTIKDFIKKNSKKIRINPKYV